MQNKECKPNPEFERRVSEATEQAILEMDSVITRELKLRYITQIFAKTLEEAAGLLKTPNYMN